MDKEKNIAMNYLHNNNNNNRPPRSAYTHAHSFIHTLPQRSIYYIWALFFRFSRCMFFFLLLIMLHRNIFVLGPAQLCISRNDDGSYDVTVLADLRSLNGKGCLSRKTGRCDFSGSQSHISLAFLSGYM